MFSQGFSQSQTLVMGFPETATQQSPEKKSAKQEDRQTCLPVTIRSIEAALAKSSGDEIRIHGSEHGMLVLVAAVESIARQPASIELSVSDGTGRIKARYYISDGQTKGLDEIAAGRYLSMFGNMRTSPVPHFVATGMRLIQSADEISYHMIECAHAALKLQHGTVVEAVAPTPQTLPQMVPQNAAPPLTQTSGLASQISAFTDGAVSKSAGRLEGTALQDAITSCLRQAADSHPEGVVLADLFTHIKSTPEADVRKVLEKLVDEGDVYTTIDDEHFACV